MLLICAFSTFVLCIFPVMNLVWPKIFDRHNPRLNLAMIFDLAIMALNKLEPDIFMMVIQCKLLE